MVRWVRVLGAIGGRVAVAFSRAAWQRLGMVLLYPPRVGALTYRVERSLGAQQPFTFLVNAKSRRFEDATVPNGSGDVTYRVTAQSSTKDGAPGYFTVRFGAQNGAEIIRQGAAEGQQGTAKGKAS